MVATELFHFCWKWSEKRDPPIRAYAEHLAKTLNQTKSNFLTHRNLNTEWSKNNFKNLYIYRYKKKERKEKDCDKALRGLQERAQKLIRYVKIVTCQERKINLILVRNKKSDWRNLRPVLIFFSSEL